MKELTIEEKAKAYDKAIRIARELYNNPNSSEIGKEWLCAVFPELKESEDEKIRKEIIEYIKTGTYHKSWLDWLEKQAITQESEWSEEDETGLTNIIIMLKEGASHHFIKDDITKAVAWLKSLKPQKQWKPTEEQINALKWQVDHTSEGLWQYKATKELLEQIKQL